MANELNLLLDPVIQNGLTVLAKVRQSDQTQVGATVTMTEPQTACYIGTYDLSTLADGKYSVDFTDQATGRLVGVGELDILNGAETSLASIQQATARVDGLIEDSGGDRFTAKALETAPTAEMDETELHSFLDSYTNKGDWKADISGLSTFDPATDTVARVTLVDTTTANTDMRGTDGANTTVPDNAGIAANNVAIGNLNDLSTADIDARLAAYGSPTLTEMTSAFTEIKGAGWTVSDTLEAIKGAIASGGISAEDIWTYATREVTGGTIDTNNDMRGTDGANTTAPDNATIAIIDGKADTIQASLSNVPTNPLQDDDPRVDRLDEAISTRSSKADVINASQL